MLKQPPQGRLTQVEGLVLGSLVRMICLGRARAENISGFPSCAPSQEHSLWLQAFHLKRIIGAETVLFSWL